MPLPFRNIQNCATGEHVDGVGKVAVGIVEIFDEMTADADAGLAGVAVTMDGHLGAGLDGVEHGLGLVVGRVAQV